jgi:cycloartenol synthase
VYLPMSYMYGARATGRVTPLVQALRAELYTRDYAALDWNAARNECAASDLYYPHPLVQARAQNPPVSPLGGNP